MKPLTRRQVLGATIAVSATPLLVFGNRAAGATDLPKVDPAEPQAKALNYVHESPKAGSNCANCQLYTGAADATWGPCAIFPGKQVASDGWCSAWVPKA